MQGIEVRDVLLVVKGKDSNLCDQCQEQSRGVDYRMQSLEKRFGFMSEYSVDQESVAVKEHEAQDHQQRMPIESGDGIRPREATQETDDPGKQEDD